MTGPAMKKNTLILWCSPVKALLVELWFERNQRVSHNKASSWNDHFEFARLNASSWGSISKGFPDYSSQEIQLNWQAFIF